MSENLKFNNTEIYENLTSLENERIKICKKIKYLKFFCFIFALFALIFVVLFSQDLIISLCVSGFISLFIYNIIAGKILKNFKANYKNFIVSLACEDENLSYEKEKFIPFEEFNKTKIFDLHFDQYSGDDLIYGQIQSVNIRFSDIFAAKMEDKILKTKFYGICFIAEFQREFNSDLMILDNKNSHTKPIFKRQKLDNVEFEAYFKTFCNDEILTRYILKTNFMPKIVALRDYFGVPIDFCFQKNKLFLYINFGKNSFEADYKIPIFSEISAVSMVKNELQKFKEIVKFLNLNSQFFKAERL